MPFLPPLYKKHRNFFVAYTGLAFFHLGISLMALLWPERYDSPIFSEVYRYIPMWLWAGKGFLIFVLMFVGIYRDDINLGRLGIGLGLFFSLARGVLIELGAAQPGSGLLVWGFVALIHYVQMAEPDHNPLTQRA